MRTIPKRIQYLIVIVVGILSIPLIAMPFTNAVNWEVMDFVVAAILLGGTGLLIDFILRKIHNRKYRIGLCVAAVFLLLAIWAQLAVGIL